MFTYFLMSENEKTLHYRQLAIPKSDDWKVFPLDEKPLHPRIGLIYRGAFLTEHYDKLNDSAKMFFRLSLHYPNGTKEEILLKDESDGSKTVENYSFPIAAIEEMDTIRELKRKKEIDLNDTVYQRLTDGSGAKLKLELKTSYDASLAVNFAYDPSPLDQEMGLIYATIVLLGLYVMIIWELVHRTFAAMIASTMSIGILAVMNQRPPMTQIMSWIDIETLLLLFGMMILVAILSETGIFDYLAVYAYKVCYKKLQFIFLNFDSFINLNYR
jgi:P protein